MLIELELGYEPKEGIMNRKTSLTLRETGAFVAMLMGVLALVAWLL